MESTPYVAGPGQAGSVHPVPPWERADSGTPAAVELSAVPTFAPPTEPETAPGTLPSLYEEPPAPPAAPAPAAMPDPPAAPAGLNRGSEEVPGRGALLAERGPGRDARPWCVRPAPHQRCAAHDPLQRLARAAGGVRPPEAQRAAAHAVLGADPAPARAVRGAPGARLRLRAPRPGPLPREPLPAARLDRCGVPCHPVRDQDAREPGRPAAGGQLRRPAARVRPRHGPDRFRQVDDTGLTDRPGQPHPQRPHHDRRGPDRVPAQAQEVGHQPARGGDRHLVVLRGSQARAASGPRHHPGRRAP